MSLHIARNSETSSPPSSHHAASSHRTPRTSPRPPSPRRCRQRRAWTWASWGPSSSTSSPRPPSPRPPLSLGGRPGHPRGLRPLWPPLLRLHLRGLPPSLLLGLLGLRCPLLLCLPRLLGLPLLLCSPRLFNPLSLLRLTSLLLQPLLLLLLGSQQRAEGFELGVDVVNYKLRVSRYRTPTVADLPEDIANFLNLGRELVLGCLWVES